tara:strand:- start:2 stop:202 length:201 start_codon:yes stop_codon:yes gene_type:complete
MKPRNEVSSMADFSKKHYVAISYLLKEILAEPDHRLRRELVWKFADMFSFDNPRFNVDKFVDAALD